MGNMFWSHFLIFAIAGYVWSDWAASIHFIIVPVLVPHIDHNCYSILSNRWFQWSKDFHHHSPGGRKDTGDSGGRYNTVGSSTDRWENGISYSKENVQYPEALYLQLHYGRNVRPLNSLKDCTVKNRMASAISGLSGHGDSIQNRLISLSLSGIPSVIGIK